MNDGTSGGVIAALQGQHLAGKIPVFGGQDADLQNLQYIAEGYQAGTIFKSFVVEAKVAAEMTVALLQDKSTLPGVNGTYMWAVSNHLVGQAVCDVPIDHRHQAVLPAHVWGDGDPEGVRQRAAREMADTARAAAALGVTRVNGFTGSSIWYMLAGFPPVSPETIDRGFDDFVERWTPILDVFQAEGVMFGLEIHPAEIAYDYWTAERTLAAMPHPAFGLNFDPSHLHWQQVDPVAFLEGPGHRVTHVHCKDAARRLNGRNGIIASHLPFGDPRRGWDFRSVGRGGIDWEEIMRAEPHRLRRAAVRRMGRRRAGP
jgi:sugar phosphate isomerase/epimerase